MNQVSFSPKPQEKYVQNLFVRTLEGLGHAILGNFV